MSPRREKNAILSSEYLDINELLEWRSNRDREEFLTSKLSLRLNEALASRPWSQEVAPLLYPIGHIIVANPISLPQTIYEVLTIYFPTDLDQKTISSIEKFRGLPCFNIEPENLPENPWRALVTNFPVMWKEGTCEYQGITAKRLVWFIEFFNMEGEQIFKEKTRRYNARGRLVSDVMGDFFGKLEDLGMIGHESIHVSFLEVVHDFPENYVSEHYVPRSPFPSFGKLPLECFEDFSDL